MSPKVVKSIVVPKSSSILSIEVGTFEESVLIVSPAAKETPVASSSGSATTYSIFTLSKVEPTTAEVAPYS